MTFSIPELALVTLIGPSGSGKSTFAHKHFKPTEILSSDYCRGLVADDENDQAATNDAFEVLHFIAAKRLAAGRLTVIDATNVQPESRRPLVALARRFHCLPVALVLNMPAKLCHERNRDRPNRNFGQRVIAQQRAQLRRSLRGLKREGFRHIHVFDTPEEVEAAEIARVPLWNNRKSEHGPFDIIGDLHGCCDELETLLDRLGYRIASRVSNDSPWAGRVYEHPEGRKVVFLGDLGDRGPRILDCFRLARNMVDAGRALCIPGNHDVKLLRKLRGKNVNISHGLAATLAEIDALPECDRKQFSAELVDFIDGLISRYVFDDGKLVVAHAGLREEMQGRGSGKVREFCLYGETTGETDEFGLPIRYNWAAEYRGRARVVYGHTPVPESDWLNGTINIDTGCVFGGSLTALRYPEIELVSVPAEKVYCEPAKPLRAPSRSNAPLTAQQQHDDLLDLADVTGKRIITTRLARNVTLREENAAAALEVMSRFAVDPKWLIYLPPTMSPCATSKRPNLLEHPDEAFGYFRTAGVTKVICEEKHMGSRAVVVVCREKEAARTRFGVADDAIGVCYTRTGRRFFKDPTIESELLDRVRTAVERSGLWNTLETDWLCLDCELMPWSAKARDLLQNQYAAVGSAAKTAFAETLPTLEETAGRTNDIDEILDRYRERADMASKFVDAYRGYCWPVDSIADLKLAPFHVLAAEGRVYADRDHAWHMTTLAEICDADDRLLLATPYKAIDLTDDAGPTQSDDGPTQGVEWWESLTARGGEGMVIKPFDFVATGRRGLIQPAVKCRGPEYLRIIYGPEYTLAKNLARLRNRGLGRKRSLALREFALGIEALERFIRREPLRRIHECVFAVLALESEPVDPRL
ncbi:MAG: polynucleotide kinase-phosphatase [Planctomycetota bacterium]|nr:polynucleotide kinase-phosphatase [Planctomycetota bacterium]